ncbi:DUF7673 family protein [Desulfosediminicola sp.]|uniref:DUF7673 family protein n=1 Tax=Desulfosediminicola sp. TaxID=2886825 RepID=UPI003AF20C70
MPKIPINRINQYTYAACVTALLKAEARETGASRVAAQVLLSAYNGYEFQLDIVDLNNLDQAHFEIAMCLIRCRYELWAEPHTVIENGSEIFQNLATRWSHYRVGNRAQA